MEQKLNWKNENEAIGHNGSCYHLEEVKISGESEPVFYITKTCKNEEHQYHSDIWGDNGDCAAARRYYNRAAAVKQCELDYTKSIAPGQIEWFYGSGRKTDPGKLNPASELTFYGYNSQNGDEYRIYNDADNPEIFTHENFHAGKVYYLAKITKNGDYSLHPRPGEYTTYTECQKLAHRDYIKEQDTQKDISR